MIDGMQMDTATAIVAPDEATLDLYCDRVAAAVGRLSVRAFGDASPDADQVARARRAFDAILALTRELGGTLSGEHGIGLLKRAAAAAELSATSDLQQAIKAAFDPTGLLNPGKGPWG